MPNEHAGFQMKRAGKRAHGAIAEDRCVLLEELLTGKKKGRISDRQINYSERGNIQGAQFFAVAGKVYELGQGEELGPGNSDGMAAAGYSGLRKRARDS